jgi:hypothetical protein
MKVIFRCSRWNLIHDREHNTWPAMNRIKSFFLFHIGIDV